MRAADVAAQYGIKNVDAFVSFAKSNFRQNIKTKMLGKAEDANIDDASIQEIVQAYNTMLEQRQFLADEEARIREMVRTMPLTSGHSFDGYHIVRYGGYVSGDEVATIPRTFWTGSLTNDNINDSIKRVREIAINELKTAAANIECNAVIGLDFDYITLEDFRGQNSSTDTKIILTANGTAVVIEPL